MKIKEPVHDEKWLLGKGWTKKKGYKVYHELLSDGESHGDYTFFEDLEGVVEKCTFYGDPLNEEFASDDLDECVELQEDYDEDEKYA